MNARRMAWGFTLVEMLLATALAALLMGGVLTATAALSRDRRRMESRTAAEHPTGAIDLIRRDLVNGTALVGAMDPGGFELVGFGGIDSKSLIPNQRLVRVSYRIVRQGAGPGVLVREQRYLDDPIRPDVWGEVVAAGVKRIELAALSGDGEKVRLGENVALKLGIGAQSAARVPSRIRIRIELVDGVMDRELVLR